MAMLNSDLGRLLEHSRTRRHGNSNSSINIDGSINSTIISSNNSDNINKNNNISISSSSEYGNDIRHVIGANPWGVSVNAQCSPVGTQLHPNAAPPSHRAADSWSSSSSDFSFTNSMGGGHAHDDGHAHAHGGAIVNSTTRYGNSTNGSPITAGVGGDNGSSSRSRSASKNTSSISGIGNTNHYGECGAGKENINSVCSSNNNTSNTSISNKSNSNKKTCSNDNVSCGSGSSGSDDSNAPSIQHVLSVSPSFFGPNDQAHCGAINGDDGSVAPEVNISIGEKIVQGGKYMEGENTGGLNGGCRSTESSYEDGDTSLGLSDLIGAIEMGDNFGTGTDFAMAKENHSGSEELRAAVESTVALVTSAQVSAKEQIATLQQQGTVFLKAKATIRALSGQLYASEAERRKLAFAIDELNAKVMVMEEEEAARENPEDYSRKMSLLALRADAAETAKNRVLRENVVLADTLAEEKRNNGQLCAEVALLKEALAKRSDVDVSMADGGFKATPAFISIIATAQTTAAAAGTPRSATRRPLCAVDPNSERSCGHGVTSPPSPAYQTSRGSLEKRTPVVWPVVPSPKTVRFTTAMSPSIVYSSPSVVSVDRGLSTTTASPEMDGSVQKTASPTSDYRNHTTSPKLERSMPQTAPTARRCSARIAAKTARDGSTPPHSSSARITTTRDNKNNTTSEKTESPVQRTAPSTRRYSARIAAKASRGSVTTDRGVATRGPERVQNESPLSSLRVLRSTSRAVEKAAAAADRRPTTEPKVKDRKRFMKF